MSRTQKPGVRGTGLTLDPPGVGPTVHHEAASRPLHGMDQSAGQNMRPHGVLSATDNTRHHRSETRPSGSRSCNTPASGATSCQALQIAGYARRFTQTITIVAFARPIICIDREDHGIMISRSNPAENIDVAGRRSFAGLGPNVRFTVASECPLLAHLRRRPMPELNAKHLSRQISATQGGFPGKQTRLLQADLMHGRWDSVSLSQDRLGSFVSYWRGRPALPAKCRKQFAGRGHFYLSVSPNPWRQQTAELLGRLSTRRVIWTWRRA